MPKSTLSPGAIWGWTVAAFIVAAILAFAVSALLLKYGWNEGIVPFIQACGGSAGRVSWSQSFAAIVGLYALASAVTGPTRAQVKR